MDVMDLRRMLLTIGGGNVAVGEFTKFEKKTMSFPNADNASNWNSGAIIPCSFTPKLVVFYGGADEATHISRGVLAFDFGSTINLGCIYGKTGSGAVTNASYVVAQNASTQKYKVENNTIYICRAAATVYWQPSDTYTFEIYG